MPPKRKKAGKSSSRVISRLAGNKVAAALLAAAMLIGLLLWYSASSGRRVEPLQAWVEEQNFVFLVPASGRALPGDIMQAPPAAKGSPRAGDLRVFESSTEVLGSLGDQLYRRTGPFNVTLTGSIDAAVRAGVLASTIGAQARAAGAESFELIMSDIEIIEVPVNQIERAVRRSPQLVEALRHPDRAVVHRILRPGRFSYRFKGSGSTGLLSRFRRAAGGDREEPVVEAGGKFEVGMIMESNTPLVIGLALARVDLPRPGEVQTASATVRPLSFTEARSLQPGASASLWPVGSTLRVRFLDGTNAHHAAFRQAMGEWLSHANLTAEYVASGAADIRVSFVQDQGNWSYVGTTALNVPADKPTIVIGQPLDREAWVDAYLHEVGHALGLVHEHQNPSASLPWNRNFAYQFFTGPPMFWTRADIEANLFNAVDYPGVRPFDSQSVMNFQLDPRLFRDRRRIGPTGGLSASDRAYIASLYPP